MSIEDPSADDLRLLSALVRVCWQYMPGGFTYLDHECMSAGELAVEILTSHGLVIRDGRGGIWTTRANFLDGLDNFDDEDFEAIKSRYLALPDREPFAPQTGYRSHQPDVQLEHLRLWFPSRAISKYSKLPKLGRTPGPDRLDVEVRLEPVGAMSTIKGEILTVAEVQEFRNQLEKIYKNSHGKADLLAYKGVLEIHIEATTTGEFGGEITVRNPLHNNSLTSDLRLSNASHLSYAIAGFDRVLTRFPAVGEGN